MNIKQLAELTGLSSHTLRYYEKIGLITDIPRGESGHRDYSQEDVEWVDFLKKLKSTGMSLEDIKTFANLRKQGCSTFPIRHKLLQNHKQKILARMDELQDFLQKIDCKLQYYAEVENKIKNS